jgi:mono/diheme cytochrome c family protein
MLSRVTVRWAVLVFSLASAVFLAQVKTGAGQASGAAGSAAATPHNVAVSADDAAKKNPIRFTDVSVARGKKRYDTQCALCHGDKGDGQGDAAKDMKLKLSDFSKPDTLANRTDGELFAIIVSGKDPMPSQKGRITEPQVWNLVNYLRSLSGKVPAKATPKEAADENIVLIPQ